MDLRFNNSNITEYYKSINSSHPIIKALKSGKLIIFVGAGMSVHLGIPSWREFALNYLQLVYKNKQLTFMNYKTKESLKNEETRKLLSICKFIANKNISVEERNNAYRDWFQVDNGKVKNGRLYEKLYDINAIYITTNYDNALDILAKQETGEEYSLTGLDKKNISLRYRGSVYYKVEEFKPDILQIGNVIHIHGSINDLDNLVISYEDYIKRYGDTKNNYSKFLSEVFSKDYIVLFIGYGLEELEILEYLLDDDFKHGENNRYLLLPCYSDDYFKISYLDNYYKENYKVEIIPYDMTDNGYDKMEEFLDYINELRKIEGTENNVIDELLKGMKLIEEI